MLVFEDSLDCIEFSIWKISLSICTNLSRTSGVLTKRTNLSNTNRVQGMKMASRPEALILYLHLDHINFPINYWLTMYGDSDWIKELCKYCVTIIFIQARLKCRKEHYLWKVDLVNQKALELGGRRVIEYPPIETWSLANFKWETKVSTSPEAIFSLFPPETSTRSHLLNISIQSQKKKKHKDHIFTSTPTIIRKEKKRRKKVRMVKIRDYYLVLVGVSWNRA